MDARGNMTDVKELTAEELSLQNLLEKDAQAQLAVQFGIPIEMNLSKTRE